MSDTVEAVASALLKAYRTRRPIQPPTQEHPGLTVEAAYAAQLRQVDAWRQDGARVVGHKVGLTAAAMRRSLGVDEPDFGHLLDTMVIPAAAAVPAARFLQPRVEPEIAFVLGGSLRGPGLSPADVIRATDFVLPALEVIDSRVADWRITLPDTVADNASSGALVLGSRPASLAAVDLTTAGVLLSRDGEIADTGAGGAVMGNPVNAVLWLANRLGELGIGLEAGHVVLSGSCTTAMPVASGHTVACTVAGLGSATVRFE